LLARRLWASLLPEMLTTELIRRGARAHADRIAVVAGDLRQTFRDVDRLSNRLAHALMAHGVARGTPVALLINNGPHSIPMDFACAKAGANRVPLNARLSLDEHAHMIRETGPQILVYGPDLSGRAEDLAARVPGLSLFGLGLAAGGGGDLLAVAGRASDADPRVPIEPDDVLVTIYTSGTTGVLKAAQHTQASFAAITLNILLNLPEVRAGDSMLHAASLLHASGTFVLPYWLRGGTSVVLPRFEPGEYLAAIDRYGATAANLVPTMLAMLLEHPGARATALPSLRTVIYGASPMPAPVLGRALERWGPRFMQYYGQTEAPVFITVLHKEEHVGEGAERLWLSCGRPSLDVEVRLVDERGEEVPEGELGEIAVRMPSLMKGYFAAPELDRAMRLPGGLLRTRDVGRFDEQGYLYLIDRSSDMIVTGGYNVYPREVEDALAAHPAVLECAVVAAPDDRWVEAVTAFVVRRPGAEAGQEELIAFVRGHLAAYKAPQSVRFVESIPKSPVGKILRRALRDPLWEGRPRRI
jgi:acyl-CoA synthetase (AMP-forming)/AMP-acid ligase II